MPNRISARTHEGREGKRKQIGTKQASLTISVRIHMNKERGRERRTDEYTVVTHVSKRARMEEEKRRKNRQA